jgi:hypothetical protein
MKDGLNRNVFGRAMLRFNTSIALLGSGLVQVQSCAIGFGRFLSLFAASRRYLEPLFHFYSATFRTYLMRWLPLKLQTW